MTVTDLIEEMVPAQPSFKRSELVDIFQMPEQSIAAMACKKIGPSYIKIGRAVRYPRRAVVDFLRNNAKLIPQA